MLTVLFLVENLKVKAIFQVSESPFFPRMKTLHTKKKQAKEVILLADSANVNQSKEWAEHVS